MVGRLLIAPFTLPSHELSDGLTGPEPFGDSIDDLARLSGIADDDRVKRLDLLYQLVC